VTIQLYDLAGADPRFLFSPFAWRVRMALLHKGLAFEVLPWRFSERDALASSGHDSVPVIRDGDTWVGDSWEIAAYLDRRYPERPLLFPSPCGEAHARLVAALCGSLLFPAAVPVGVLQAYRLLSPACQPYFRASREAMFNARLEDVHADEHPGRARLAEALRIFDEVLAHHDFIGGASPTYADFLVFGILKWLDIVSAYAPLTATTPSGQWFTRLNEAYDGYAGRVPRVRD
jgi:glutathione S-transferase